MKRIIKFGGRSALLCVGDNRALLTTKEVSLPTALADAINDTQDVIVTGVSIIDNQECIIRIIHDLQKSELLNVVCEALSTVYDVDTSVTNARS